MFNDPCLFSRRDSDGSVLIVCVYVDDIVLAHSGERFIWFDDKFACPEGFRAKQIGPLSWFLGAAVEQKNDLKSPQIANTVCTKFGQIS